MNKYIDVYSDGACEPVNPKGIATYGYVIYINNKRVREDYGVVAIGEGATNNVAEYTAVIKALEYLIFTGKNNYKVTVYSDSQLLIRQLNGVYEVRSRNIIPLYDYINKLRLNFKRLRFRWIPREENEEADKLSKKAYYEYLRENPDVIERYRKYMITEKQKNYIIILCKKLDREIPKDIDLISKREASRIIKQLISLLPQSQQH